MAIATDLTQYTPTLQDVKTNGHALPSQEGTMDETTKSDTTTTTQEDASPRRWEIDYPGERTLSGERAWRKAMITEAVRRAALPYELMALKVVAQLEGLTRQQRVDLLDGLLGIAHASAAVATEFANALRTMSATPETAALEDREATLKEIGTRCNLGNDGRQIQDAALAARLERECRAYLDRIEPRPENGGGRDAA